MQGTTDYDNESVWCDGCGAEVSWAPVVAPEGQFCCEDCVIGLPCECRERTSLDVDERRGAPAYERFDVGPVG